MVHSYTKCPEDITRQGDIVISAAGVANLVRGSWLKPGAVVIDVGINPVDVSTTESFLFILFFQIIVFPEKNCSHHHNFCTSYGAICTELKVWLLLICPNK